MTFREYVEKLVADGKITDVPANLVDIERLTLLHSEVPSTPDKRKFQFRLKESFHIVLEIEGAPNPQVAAGRALNEIVALLIQQGQAGIIAAKAGR